MSILVNTHNEYEEKVLIAFLESLKYDYRSDITEEEASPAFLEQYNKEIDAAEADIEAGNFVTHQDVVQLFANRRKNLGS